LSAFARLKRFVGRSLDVLGWFLFGRGSVRFHHWSTRDITNKGDIAIREALKEKLSELFFPRVATFTELHWDELVPDRAEQIDENHDLFVIGGGGYIFSDENGDLNPRAEQDLATIAKMYLPKIACGIGWNKLIQTGNLREERVLSQKSREILKATLQRLDLVSVRDAGTQLVVSEITGREPVLTGDPALFYRGNQTEHRFTDGRLHVGVNMALHGKERVEFIAKQHEPFCEALVEFARRHNVVYHYMQHAYTERPIPWMLRAKGVVVTNENLPVCELPAFYAALDIHVCQMLHSAILAVNAGTPTLHYGYDVKSVGFFDFMRMPEFCFPDWPLDAERMLVELESLLKNRQRIRSHIARRKEEVRPVSEVFFKNVKTLVTKECTQH
jgi:polysaccharide pyruvyl transferase WcaK-like protein